MTRNTKSAPQQRSERTRNQMAAFNLGLLLRDLVRRVMAKDWSAVAEFQQAIQFAPSEMKAEIENYVSQTERSSK